MLKKFKIGTLALFAIFLVSCSDKAATTNNNNNNLNKNPSTVTTTNNNNVQFIETDTNIIKAENWYDNNYSTIQFDNNFKYVSIKNYDNFVFMEPFQYLKIVNELKYKGNKIELKNYTSDQLVTDYYICNDNAFYFTSTYIENTKLDVIHALNATIDYDSGTDSFKFGIPTPFNNSGYSLASFKNVMFNNTYSDVSSFYKKFYSNVVVDDENEKITITGKQILPSANKIIKLEIDFKVKDLTVTKL